MISHPGKHLIGWVVIGLLLTTAKTSGAAQYRLQVANLEEKLFFRYVETQGAPLNAERHVLPRLEAELDRGAFPKGALLSGYTVQPVTPTAAGQFESVAISVMSPQRSNSWTVASWEGTAGKTVVLQISSFQTSYQELVTVAVNTNDVLRRLPVQGVPLFGSQKLLVPALSSTYLEHALNRGTFVTLLARYATSLDGLSVVVGRNHDPQYPDAVYLQVQMPPEAKTYKVVLAWKNRAILEKGGDRGKERD